MKNPHPSFAKAKATFPLVRKGEGLSLIICEKRYVKPTFESIKGRFDLVNIAKQESLLLCKVFFYHFENVGREEENADQVGDEHKPVESIGNAPDKVQVCNCAND